MYGRLLCDAGRWPEAESALRLGVGAAELVGSRRLRVDSRGGLADLRIRQGRLGEAGQLLEGSEDRVETAHPRPQLRLARHELELAAAVARQALRELNEDCLRGAPLLLLIVDAEARAALAVFEPIGAPEVEDETALLHGLGVAVRTQARGGRAVDQLSPRERDVLVQLGRALSNPEIADVLVVSGKTVGHHVTSILSKLGLRSRAETAVYAVTTPAYSSEHERSADVRPVPSPAGRGWQ